MTTPKKTLPHGAAVPYILIEDYLGKKFGRLTVIGPGGRNAQQMELWRCRCDCGKEVSTSKYTLRAGRTLSCGCIGREGFIARSKANTSKQDLTGRVFGRLTVICLRNEGRLKKTRFWLCQCECGKETVVSKFNLLDGMTKSCGCWYRDSRGKASTTHGMSHTRTYHIWQGMLARCFNPSKPRWKDYGGRGITVSPEWLNFENFFRDMGECPGGKSIDRFPDNDGNYELGNCRWATAQEQAVNKRKKYGGRCMRGHLIEGDNKVTVSDGKRKTPRSRCKMCLSATKSAWQRKNRMEKRNASATA